MSVGVWLLLRSDSATATVSELPPVQDKELSILLSLICIFVWPSTMYNEPPPLSSPSNTPTSSESLFVIVTVPLKSPSSFISWPNSSSKVVMELISKVDWESIKPNSDTLRICQLTSVPSSVVVDSFTATLKWISFWSCVSL